MNNKGDIKKQLQIKNQEIYRNKLYLDLERNLEGLVLTVNNLLNNTSKNALSKIQEIKESFFYERDIIDNLNEFIEGYRHNFLKLIEKKKKLIKNDISKDIYLSKNKKNLYFDLIKEEIVDFSQKSILKLNKNLNYIMETSFEMKRLSDYLNDILLVNLNNKIFEVLKNRDVILINSFEESYQKYLELNKNTIDLY